VRKSASAESGTASVKGSGVPISVVLMGHISV
jgi:hypothetical protein